MKRRIMLVGTIATGALFTAGALGIPAIVAALSPNLRRRRQAVWRPVGPVSNFPPGVMSEAVVPRAQPEWPRTFEELGVYVWRPSETDFVVFSRICTDLGCPVNYDPGSQCFYCPCHGGIFAKDGTRMAGPPPRPLYRYASRVRRGILEIDPASVPPVS